MANLLSINSSARTTGSVSRELLAEFVAQWRAANPAGTVVERDLAAQPVPHLTEAMIGAFFTPADQRSAGQAELIRLSDDLVDELLAADTLVIASPMYNFSVPSGFKAWIDHVCRAGRTFRYTATGVEGLVHGKKAYVLTSRGGVYSQGPAKAMDHHETYLRSVLGFIGITDVSFLNTEGLAYGEEAAASAKARTREAMAAALAA